jgi:hypothetical protein
VNAARRWEIGPLLFHLHHHHGYYMPSLALRPVLVQLDYECNLLNSLRHARIRVVWCSHCNSIGHLYLI